MENKILHIDTSQVCNLNCLYCCEWLRKWWYLYLDTKLWNILSDLEFNSKIFLSLLKNTKNWYSGVVFSKWEPTLNNWLKRFIKFALNLWYKDIEIVTNWLRISNLEYLNWLKKAWLTKVTISYNSVFPEINKIVSWVWSDLKNTNIWILNAKKLWLFTNINIVLNKHNLIWLDKTVTFLKKFKPDNLIISFIRYYDFNHLNRFTSWNKVEINKVSYWDFLEKYSKKSEIFSNVKFNDFPICVLEKIWQSSSSLKVKDYNFFDFTRSKEINLDWLWQNRVYLKKCKKCKFINKCCWIEREYLDIFKDSINLEINPL